MIPPSAGVPAAHQIPLLAVPRFVEMMFHPVLFPFSPKTVKISIFSYSSSRSAAYVDTPVLVGDSLFRNPAFPVV